jgi:GTPase SAR1 family protein
MFLPFEESIAVAKRRDLKIHSIRQTVVGLGNRGRTSTTIVLTENWAVLNQVTRISDSYPKKGYDP